MKRKPEIIIERRYADPSDPEYRRDQEICAAVLLDILRQTDIVNGADGK